MRILFLTAAIAAALGLSACTGPKSIPTALCNGTGGNINPTELRLGYIGGRTKNKGDIIEEVDEIGQFSGKGNIHGATASVAFKLGGDGSCK